jgi:glycosyltransferase involved in cell wall biosynthesis
LARKADILYSQDLYTAGLVGLILKKICKKPLVTRFVGDSAWEIASAKGIIVDDIMIFQEKKYGWSVELRKKIRKKILLNSDQVIVVSGFLKSLAQKIGLPENKIKVIYNSVDFLEIESNFDKNQIKKELGLEGRVMLTLARLTPWKGVDMLIEIMPDLLKDFSDLKFVILGSGQELEKLKKLSQSLDLGQSVIFKGKTNRDQVIRHFQAADLFVLNTNYEGMSHCLLEAMKVGVPVITTKAGGNLETLKNGETGILVDWRDKKQWIEAIKKILADDFLSQKLTLQAKKDLEERFVWRDLVQKTTDVFENI